MGFLKKVVGSYPATQNRISQNQQHQHGHQQQGTDPAPMPDRVYQSNGIPVAPVAATAYNPSADTAHAHAAPTYATIPAQPAAAYNPTHAQAAPTYASTAATPARPVMATAYVPGQATAAVPAVATAYVPNAASATTSSYASAPAYDLPPPVAPPSYNPAVTAPQNYHYNTNASKFWECSRCTFPNLRTEDTCKGCGAPIPPGLSTRPASTYQAASHVPQSHTYAPQQHQNVSSVTQQMNNMHVSNNTSSGTMRVPVPTGMNPGQKIKVRSPDGKEVVKAIPPTSEWLYDDHGKPFFRMVFGAAAVATGAVVAGSTVPDQTTSRPPPYATTWRAFHPRASSAYSPPPIGMRSVPYSPRNTSSVHPNGRHKSLLIGINYTGTRAALKGCVNDAKNMQQLLLQNGFPNDGAHMLLLTDERSRGSEYQPTASNIMKAFAWFLKDVQKGDVLFLHFSGHGGQVPDKTGMESDGYNETVVPLDYDRAGQISDDVLWGSLVYPLPEGVRLTALMDMCHSGTGLDLPYDYNVDTRRWREDVNPAHSKGDVVLFSGCEDAQTSADVQGGWGKAGGAMTMAFTKAYQQCQMATYHEFLTVIKRELRKKGFKQRPQLTSSQQFDANSRIFSFGHLSSSGGLPTMIESNHNPEVGRKKNRHVRPARPGFGGGGSNDLFAMAAAGAGAMLFANALGNIFDA